MTMMPFLAALLLSSGTPHARTPHGPLPGPVEAPLHLVGGHMVVPVLTADGTELTFLVSTGSPVTLLSESGAAHAAGSPLSLAGVPLKLEDSRTVPDARLTVDGRVMDGMVGTNTLNAFDMLFDVPGGRLVLQPVGPSVSWPGVALSDPIRLRVYHGVVLALDVTVQGREYPAMLEMSSPALLVNQRVLDETGTADGDSVLLEIDGATFADVPVELSDHPSIARFSPRGDGFVIVGTAPALTCPVAISFAHREMRTCAP